jgi:predicted regulator of Ras-like GTPase activity (Roadblock/LC7/MglB family)
MSIIMDAMKMKDEVKQGKTLELPPQTGDGENHNRAFEADWRQAVRDDDEEEDEGNPADDRIIEPAPAATQVSAAEKINIPPASCSTEGCTTNLESILKRLRGIKGYKGSGIMDFTGETIAADSLESHLDLARAGAVFNDIFRSAQETAEASGLHACNELTLKTRDCVIILCASGDESAVPFHLIAVLNKDGNQALTKMQLAKIIPLAAQELN